MPKKLLVVEDDPDLRSFEEALLVDAGLTVETAADGPAAMAKLRTTRYDAIVLDVGLPGLDGLEIARRRIEYPLNARTPIVLVTGARAPEAVRLGFSAGVVVLMHKPFAALTFLSIIQSVIPEA